MNKTAAREQRKALLTRGMAKVFILSILMVAALTCVMILLTDRYLIKLPIEIVILLGVLFNLFGAYILAKTNNSPETQYHGGKKMKRISLTALLFLTQGSISLLIVVATVYCYSFGRNTLRETYMYLFCYGIFALSCAPCFSKMAHILNQLKLKSRTL